MDWAYGMIERLDSRSPRRPAGGAHHVDDHRAGDSDRQTARLWTVLIFLLWYAIFVDGSIDSPPSASRSTGQL